MRGIERLVAGALLVMAVTSTAVLARTSAPGGGHALALRTPPRSHAVAPLPVVVAAPEAPPPQLVRPSAPRVEALVRRPVALVKPVQPPASPPPTPPVAPTAAPTPPRPPAPPTRVLADAQTTTTTKRFGNSHPRGHAWGHLKHAAVTTVSVDDSQGGDDNAQQPDPVAATPVAPPQSEDENGNGNGNGHAWGHSKH